MTMTDPVADMLTRVRNGLQAGQKRIDMPLSKLKVEVAKKLAEAHFIENVKVLDDGERSFLRLYLKYTPDGKPVIRELRRVSRPGRRAYVGKADIPRVRAGSGCRPDAATGRSRGSTADGLATRSPARGCGR